MDAARKEAAVQRDAHQRELDTAREAASARRAASHEKRMASLETRENVSVVWSERRTSRTRNEQWLERREGCTVRFSGSRVYITLPNGSEVIKTRQTVQINNEELPAGHAVRKFLERQSGAASTP